MIKQITTDKLNTYVFETRDEMGKNAAKAAKEAINAVIAEKGFANVVFAAAPSQNETLKYLLKEEIDFTRINAFHMDEYVGLDIGSAQSFATYLTEHIFALAPFKSVNLIPAKNGEEGIAAYTRLLTEYPTDVVLMGIGENGHIAFNDPPVADFNDPYLIKKVELDEICRNQQVHDKCFETLDDVPRYALTLTVPALMRAKYLICTVPAPTKAQAVKAMLTGPIGTLCPATALRGHDNAKMFLDKDSASLVL